MNGNNEEERQLAWSILGSIVDPEIPVLPITDLGIVRDVDIAVPHKKITVSISPTYSGCPAMDVIAASIRLKLISHGYDTVDVISVLSPAWTTDWISEEGKRKLKEFGIAPPVSRTAQSDFFDAAPEVQCPLCGSIHTFRISEFGSTACKAMYKCDDCLETFDAFKCH